MGMLRQSLGLIRYLEYLRFLEWLKENIILTERQERRVDALLTKDYIYWTDDDIVCVNDWLCDADIMEALGNEIMARRF